METFRIGLTIFGMSIGVLAVILALSDNADTAYKSPWARQYNNPLKRRQGEGYKHHEDRLARYAVIAMVIIAVILMAWTAKAVPEESVNTKAGNVRFHGSQNYGGLHE